MCTEDVHFYRDKLTHVSKTEAVPFRTIMHTFFIHDILIKKKNVVDKDSYRICVTF